VLLIAHAQSALGTGAAAVALVVLAYKRFHSPWAITLVLLADFLPAMVLGPLFGAAVDRLNIAFLYVPHSAPLSTRFAAAICTPWTSGTVQCGRPIQPGSGGGAPPSAAGAARAPTTAATAVHFNICRENLIFPSSFALSHGRARRVRPSLRAGAPWRRHPQESLSDFLTKVAPPSCQDLAVLRLLPLVVFAALLVPATAQASSGDPLFPDISAARAALLAPVPPSWGGEYTVADNYRVNVRTSDVYPVDDQQNQDLADFLDRALHGPEIQTVTIYRVSPSEITEICGSADALACYAPSLKELFTPVEPATSEFSWQGALLHEYGHHVANSRTNTPFRPTVDYGPKRWASYENVCALTKRGKLHPGAETFPQYKLNPGEGWAESYRVVNEGLLGLAQEDIVVDGRFYPNTRATQLLRQDVVNPWKQGPASTLTGRLAAGRSRTYRIATPLDGAFTIRAPAGLALTVLGPTKLKSGSGSVSTTICGQRSLKLRVTAKRAQSYRLRIMKP
jgi:hypothetical protein